MREVLALVGALGLVGGGFALNKPTAPPAVAPVGVAEATTDFNPTPSAAPAAPAQEGAPSGG